MSRKTNAIGYFEEVKGDSTILTNNIIVNGVSAERSLSVPTPIYKAVMSFDGKVSNSQGQVEIADAMGWPVLKGRNAAAANWLEKLTPGYGKFNSAQIGLLVGSLDGSRRFFETAKSVKLEPAVMATRQNKGLPPKQEPVIASEEEEYEDSEA